MRINSDGVGSFLDDHAAVRIVCDSGGSFPGDHNILRLEGRRLRSFPTPFGMEKEKYDIQAAFPIIMREWIVDVE